MLHCFLQHHLFSIHCFFFQTLILPNFPRNDKPYFYCFFRQNGVYYQYVYLIFIHASACE